MTLENLLGIGRLHPHKATATEIRRLLASAEAALADARRSQNSAATRFDMGYKAIMQCALAALMANGFRPSTSARDGRVRPILYSSAAICSNYYKDQACPHPPRYPSAWRRA